MPIRRKYYDIPATPTTVSRDLPPGERSFEGLVFQSGKPVLDAELNLTQDALEYLSRLIHEKQLPSGFLRPQSRESALSDYSFPGTTANAFTLSKRVAIVDGSPLVLEYVNTSTSGQNLIQLSAAPAAPAPPGSIKRTDFVFLEVWRALVAPSPKASGTFTITVILPVPGDLVTIDTSAAPFLGPIVPLMAVPGPAGPGQFQIGVDPITTAANLATAINLPANGLNPYVTANSNLTAIVTVTAVNGGAAGNVILLSSSTPNIPVNGGGVGPSPLVGGADRPNKPTQSKIYRHGNVNSDPATWLDDDLVDPVIGVECAQRVQLQYRLRVYGQALLGVNPRMEPDGFSNAGILAQGATAAPVATYPFVPADGTTVSGNSSAVAYGTVDNGLWIAGDGTKPSATALGTLDGYVFAIPVCFVFRRDDASLTGGFNPDGDANGALAAVHGIFNNTHLSVTVPPTVIPANTSDRPDGYFHDVIVPTDILDLRRHVSPSGLDLTAELQYQIQSLMDGTLFTWQLDGSDKQEIGNGTGGPSTQFLVCDEIGRHDGSGGGGDTPRGVSIRDFDHVCRRFGAQPIVARHNFVISPNPASNPPGITVVNPTYAHTTRWRQGDVISIDFSVLRASSRQDWTTPSAYPRAVGDLWAANTKVTDLYDAIHDDGLLTGMANPFGRDVQINLIEGVGTKRIDITLGVNRCTVDGGTGGGTYPMVGNTTLDDGSTRPIFVELEITYSPGNGLTNNPDVIPTPAAPTVYPTGPILENNSDQRPSEMKNTWIPTPVFREGFREVVLEQVSKLTGSPDTPVTEFVVSTDTTSIVLSRRISRNTITVIDTIFGLPIGVDVAATEYGSSSRLLKLAGPPLMNPQTLCQVTYFPQDPIPNAGDNGYQVSLYYRTNAPQTAGVKQFPFDTGSGGGPVPTALTLKPLVVGNVLYSGNMGPGSTELPYPYAEPLAQIPCATNRRDDPLYRYTFSGDWEFCGISSLSISDFTTKAGLVTLFPFVQMDGTVQLKLGGTHGPIADAEMRAFYDYIDSTQYRPAAGSQPFTGASNHKVFLPMLARATGDCRLFRKGEILLVVLSAYAPVSSKNVLGFVTDRNFTSAAIYRSKNLLLMAGE